MFKRFHIYCIRAALTSFPGTENWFRATEIRVTHTSALPNGCNTAMLPARGRRTGEKYIWFVDHNVMELIKCRIVWNGPRTSSSSDKADAVVAQGKSKAAKSPGTVPQWSIALRLAQSAASSREPAMIQHNSASFSPRGGGSKILEWTWKMDPDYIMFEILVLPETHWKWCLALNL